MTKGKNFYTFLPFYYTTLLTKKIDDCQFGRKKLLSLVLRFLKFKESVDFFEKEKKLDIFYENVRNCLLQESYGHKSEKSSIEDIQNGFAFWVKSWKVRKDILSKGEKIFDLSIKNELLDFVSRNPLHQRNILHITNINVHDIEKKHPIHPREENFSFPNTMRKKRKKIVEECSPSTLNTSTKAEKNPEEKASCSSTRHRKKDPLKAVKPISLHLRTQSESVKNLLAQGERSPSLNIDHKVMREDYLTPNFCLFKKIDISKQNKRYNSPSCSSFNSSLQDPQHSVLLVEEVVGKKITNVSRPFPPLLQNPSNQSLFSHSPSPFFMSPKITIREAPKEEITLEPLEPTLGEKNLLSRKNLSQRIKNLPPQSFPHYLSPQHYGHKKKLFSGEEKEDNYKKNLFVTLGKEKIVCQGEKKPVYYVEKKKDRQKFFSEKRSPERKIIKKKKDQQKRDFSFNVKVNRKLP